jgi:hypothetical protein
VRTFHRLVHYDPLKELMRVVHYTLGDFDPTALWDGEPVTSGIPSAVRLFVAPGVRPDSMANALSWPICSERFAEILSLRATNDVQVFGAPLFESPTGKAVAGYKIVNVVRKVQCLDFANSEVSYDAQNPGKIIGVHRIAVIASRVPPDVHIFRMKEWPYEVIFSGELANDCVGKRLLGVAFQECATSG